MTKDFLQERVGRIDQVASIRRSVLDDGKGRGMRVIDVRNASGLAFSIYPDKGLDIGQTDFNGCSLTWGAPNGEVAPAFYDAGGAEWLRSWAGGLMTTCGWLNVGGACDTREGAQGIHGRFDNIPAADVNTRCEWLDDGRYLMEVTGTITHCRVFGEKLQTKRTIRTYMGMPEIEIIDRTENLGYEAMPFMQLYHMNFGWPLVDENSFIETIDHEVIGQNDYCRANLDKWNRFQEPTAGFREQVIYHDIPSDKDGMCDVKLVNPSRNLSVTVSFRKKELPYYVEWKMCGKGEYVWGIEPANCYPEGQNAIAERGMLRYIQPGEVVENYLKVKIN